ncbi:hypothetical protein P7C73_g1067, partial [Tremellales sp. Uapishka_1]
MTILTAWTPLRVGDVTLQHRVVLAPLTRCRASPSTHQASTWVPNELMRTYYEERSTPGGLLISEASPVSLRASGAPGIPGWFTTEQQQAWSMIIDAVHAKGAIFFTQLWHQGRNTHSTFIGQTPDSSSAVALEGNMQWSGVAPAPFEVPRAMTQEDIISTEEDFVKAAVAARKAGCDGIEIHAGNGNINQRTDDYGGSIENRCRFTLETIDKLCAAIGSGRVAVRLSPFGLFNQTYGTQRVEQWVYLCQELAKRKLAYVHMIEPRFDEFKSASEKQAALGDMSVASDISLAPFRRALGSTPLLAAGGFGPDNLEKGFQDGSYDFVAFGRYFCSNPDLVDRLREELPLYKWDRSRFYGPFEDNAIGYTVHRNQEFSHASDRLKAQLAD